MKEYLDMWKNYANFSGKTNIRGYWMAFLFNVIAGFIVGTIAGLIGLEILGTLYTLAALIPGLALTVRRLQDAGFKWTGILVSLIPFVGTIILIIKLCKPSVSEAAPAVVEV